MLKKAGNLVQHQSSMGNSLLLRESRIKPFQTSEQTKCCQQCNSSTINNHIHTRTHDQTQDAGREDRETSEQTDKL